MAAFGDGDVEGIVDFRTVVAVVDGGAGKRQQAIEPRNERGVELYGRYIRGDVGHQRVEKLCLYRQNLVLRAEYLLLVFLEFLSDVALGVDECLLAYPFRRHLVLMRVAHLDVVAEHVVVGYFQARYAGCLALALLYVHKVVLSGVGNLPQVVELVAHALADDVAAVGHIGSVRI